MTLEEYLEKFPDCTDGNIFVKEVAVKAWDRGEQFRPRDLYACSRCGYITGISGSICHGIAPTKLHRPKLVEQVPGLVEFLLTRFRMTQ